MGIVYKIDILKALKDKGYNTNRIRIENILSQATIHSIRHKNNISLDSLSAICKLLELQPGDILEYVEDTDTKADIQ